METTERRRPRELPTVSFVISVLDGAEAGKTVTVDPFHPSRVLVGKSPVCDIVLTNSMVSRRHVAFEVIDYRLVLTDLDSMNGTYANGVSVATAFLEGGETIRVGEVTLRVDLASIDGGGPHGASAPVVGEPGQAAFGRLIGQSPRMRVLYTLCARLAASDIPVVIEGETGTGKELVAECIHEASARAAAPFVVFDASAVPRGSLELTLFGQAGQPGTTFDGQKGMFELAHGGTLFMDAIDELAIDVQAKVLRAIDRGEILRVGDAGWRRVNVRVIAATNRNLDKLVEEQRFRDDLFFRLAVTRLEIPPLRRREGDVPLLAHHFFLRHHQNQNPHETDRAAEDFLTRYEGHEWPGNVRELENAVARFAALGDAANLLPTRGLRRSHPPAVDPHPSAARTTPGNVAASADGGAGSGGDFIQQVVGADLSYADARARILDAFERLYVERVLAQNGGNVSRAAAASGLARRYFQTLRSRQKR